MNILKNKIGAVLVSAAIAVSESQGQCYRVVGKYRSSGTRNFNRKTEEKYSIITIKTIGCTEVCKTYMDDLVTFP